MAKQQAAALSQIAAAKEKEARVETGSDIGSPDLAPPTAGVSRLNDPPKPGAITSPVDPVAEAKGPKSWSKQKNRVGAKKQKPPLPRSPNGY